MKFYPLKCNVKNFVSNVKYRLNAMNATKTFKLIILLKNVNVQQQDLFKSKINA